MSPSKPAPKKAAAKKAPAKKAPAKNAKPAAPERQAVKISEPRQVRALAHPARLAVLEELYAGRELTATECAEIAGMTPSAMSYHLRSLERAGIVKRAEPSGDGRERPWRAAGEYLQVDSGSSALALAANAALTSTLVTRLAADLDTWAARKDKDPDWRELGGVSSGQLWLTPDEARELADTEFELFDQYRSRATGDKPEGARRVRVATFLIPIDRG